MSGHRHIAVRGRVPHRLARGIRADVHAYGISIDNSPASDSPRPSIWDRWFEEPTRSETSARRLAETELSTVVLEITVPTVAHDHTLRHRGL